MIACFIIEFKLIFRTNHILEPAQACDILKGIILVVCCIIVNYIDTSMMNHLVRGQAVIKLYVFYNMLDVSKYISDYCWLMTGEKFFGIMARTSYFMMS
jgi:hypothetical protein